VVPTGDRANLGPSFDTVHRSFTYFVFDRLVLAGRNVPGEPLATRRALLEKRILPKLADPIRQSPELRASLPDLIHLVKAQGLEIHFEARTGDSRDYVSPSGKDGSI
jgi:hypothetical protein